VVFRVEASEVLKFLEMLERSPARIQNRLSGLMQKRWEQNVAPEKMIDDKALKRCYGAHLELEFEFV
jgi:hypothetical protein